MGGSCGGIRQASPIRRVRSRGPDEPSPTGYWSNRYEVRCGALPTDGLVDRVLGLGLDGLDYLVKEHRLELLFPVRWASAGRDSWGGTGLADVIEDALHGGRFDDGRLRHPASRGISTSRYVKAMMRISWPQRGQLRGRISNDCRDAGGRAMQEQLPRSEPVARPRGSDSGVDRMTWIRRDPGYPTGPCPLPPALPNRRDGPAHWPRR